MNARPKQLSREDLVRLAAEPDNVVYEYTHTQLEEPMDMDRVEQCTRQLFLLRARYAQEHASYEEDAARAWILEEAASPELREFCSFTHHPIFQHLTRKNVGSQDLKKVLGMIDVKRAELAGAPAEKLAADFQSKVVAHTRHQSSSSLKRADRK
jgi:hypothetical protein